MRDFRDAKAMAHALRDALKSRTIETTHSDCLELIANAFGYDNWNVLAAKIEAAEPRAGVMPALSPGGAPDSAPQKTLYCSFCGKSQHFVHKLIAGPLVYICDECVQLCTKIIGGEDPFWTFWRLLPEAEKGENNADAAALEHLRDKPTDDVASLLALSRQFAERNRVVMQCIRRKLAMRPDEKPKKDDILNSPEFAYLNTKSKKELLDLQRGALRAVKRGESALRIGTAALAERKPQHGEPGLG